MNREIVLFAVPWCAKCRKVRTFLEASDLDYLEMNPEEDHEYDDKLREAGEGAIPLPAVLIGDELLVNPTGLELAKALGVDEPENIDVFDAVIIGGGPAGLTAAIYAARENMATLVLEKGMGGGQAALTGEIENYPGFPDPVAGAELMERVARQAKRFGAEIKQFEEVRDLRPKGRIFEVETESEVYQTCCVVVATGSVYRRMGVAGEEKLIGRGVSFCATCDAPFFRDKPVVVVGGGNSALQETIHLAEFASEITLVQILDHLTGSRVLVDRVESMEKVEVLLGHRVLEVVGDHSVEGVKVLETETGVIRTVDCDGVFVFIGMDPNTEFLKGIVDLDEYGFIVTEPGSLQTSLEGVFAAGDVRSQSSKQITAAVGEGTVTSYQIKQRLEEKRKG